jgi:hypothetical protein
MIRLGLGLIALASLAAIAVLLSNALLASSLPPGAKSSSVAKDAHAPAKNLELGVAEVAKSSAAEQLASMERARAQISSLVVDAPVDWAAFTSASNLELVPTSLDDMDQLVLFAGLDQSAADSMPLASAIGQLARADIASAGYSEGSHGRWGNFSGGGSGGVTGGGGAGGRVSGADRSGYSSSGRDSGGNVMAFSSPAGVERNESSNNGAANGRANGNGAVNGNGPNGAANGAAAPGLARAGGAGVANVTSVPEPSTLLLTAAGLSSLVLSRRRKKAQR